jgi:hypothetical protein
MQKSPKDYLYAPIGNFKHSCKLNEQDTEMLRRAKLVRADIRLHSHKPAELKVMLDGVFGEEHLPKAKA